MLARAEAAVIAEIVSRVRHDGVVVLHEPFADGAFLSLAARLGAIVEDTRVRVVPGKQTYLARPDPIPFHTDHPKADLIAWRCEDQDTRDGSSLLLDGRAVVEGLHANVRAALRRIELPAIVRLGDAPTDTPIVSSRNDVFYAPWLEPRERPIELHDALVAFRAALARAEPSSRAVRLQPGQVLIVDNHRVLHGRGQLLPDSPRRLRRLWIARSTAPRRGASAWPS